MDEIKFLYKLKIPQETKYIFYVLKMKGEVIYIGQSSNGVKRAFSHNYAKEYPKQFDEVVVFQAPEDKKQRCRFEIAMIDEFKPSQNKRKKFT